MRLAEFKMRLFHFFAQVLRQWAGTIEPKIVAGQSPPASQAEEASAVQPAEAAGDVGDESGPPEHWARLVRTAPPEHWLDLFREESLGVPQAIDSAEGGEETSGPAVSSFETGKETADVGPDDLQRKSRPPIRIGTASQSGRGGHEEPTWQSATTTAKTWLNRLRFSPPVSRSVTEPNVYLQDERTADEELADYSAEMASGAGNRFAPTFREPRSPRAQTTDGGPDETASRSRSQSPGQTPNPSPGRTVAPLRANSANSAPAGDEASGRDFPALNYLAAKRGESQPSHVEPRRSWNSPKQTRLESETMDSPREPPRLRSRSNRDFGKTERDGDALSTKSDQMPNTNTPERAEQDSSSRIFSNVQSRRPTLYFSSEMPAKEKEGSPGDQGMKNRALIANANQYVTKEEQRRHGLSVVAESRRLIDSTIDSRFHSNNDSGVDSDKGRWPTLPAALPFEMADELLAREAEAEGLRRLEREQRGIRWNA